MWAIWRLYGIITHMFRQDEYDIPCAIWRLWLPVVALVAILAGCATIPKLDTANPAEEIRWFYVEEVGDPNCSVAIVHDGHIVYAGDEHAIYRIGSLTKLFVAELAERMAVKGEIDLDAPVTRYSQYALAPAYGSVTLRDLMTHRSGLPIDFLNPWNPLDWHIALMCGLTGSRLYGAFNSQEDFVKYANSSRTLRFLAAREPAYSNVGFALFATALEDAAGKSISDMFRTGIAEPMGLDDTSFLPSAEQKKRLVRPSAGKLPWLYRRGSQVPVHEPGRALIGMGGLYSSAADCAKFFSSCDLTRPGRLAPRVLPSGRTIDYRFGMIYGGESFLCRDRATGDILLILRNVTSWPATEDFTLADRLFSNSLTF